MNQIEAEVTAVDTTATMAACGNVKPNAMRKPITKEPYCSAISPKPEIAMDTGLIKTLLGAPTIKLVMVNIATAVNRTASTIALNESVNDALTRETVAVVA